MIMGLFGRDGVSVGNGSGFGYFHGTEWCYRRNDGGRALSLVLYVPYQKIIL